jgi:CheY-like chemotaxis protein
MRAIFCAQPTPATFDARQNEICILFVLRETSIKATEGIYMTETSEQTPIKRKVIVADDVETIATTLELILKQAGFEARAVFSGEQVIELLDSFEPDMLIIDVVMPGMTGIEVAIAVRNRLPDCKILLLSGQAATADLLEQAKTHGHEFEIVAKPIHPSDLLTRLGVSNIDYS